MGRERNRTEEERKMEMRTWKKRRVGEEEGRKSQKGMVYNKDDGSGG
jgi:hypothetical protein